MRLIPMALAAAALALAGCGSGESSTAAGPPGKADPQVQAKVPAAVRSNGTLTVATDATYPPVEFTQGGDQIVGLDPDLAQALGDVMGLKVRVVNATFDGILPGLAAGKYDLGMAAFTDTREREKTVDFVTYFSAGTSFYVPADGGAAIATVGDLCGHKVAVEKGTIQADAATAQGKKCDVEVLTFPDQNGANLALSSGRAEVGMADSPVADWLVKKSAGKFELSGEPYGTAPYGIAIPKGSGMAEPLQAALKVLIERGTYAKILEKWGVQSGAIAAPAVNGAES
jgi:polar amino acid transport system substrate-binding protein